MANAAKEKPIEVRDDAELGLAILIAEFGDGNSVMVSINEARESAASDMHGRTGARRRAGLPGALRLMGTGARRQLPPGEGDHAVAPTPPQHRPTPRPPGKAGLRS